MTLVATVVAIISFCKALYSAYDALKDYDLLHALYWLLGILLTGAGAVAIAIGVILITRKVRARRAGQAGGQAAGQAQNGAARNSHLD